MHLPPGTTIEDLYQQRIDAMTPAERWQRMHAMLHWVRELYARQVREQLGEISEERLKWEVALRQYGHDPVSRELIEGKLQQISH